MKCYLLLAEIDYEGDSKCGLVTSEDLAKRWVVQQLEWKRISRNYWLETGFEQPKGYMNADSYDYREIEVDDAGIEDILKHEWRNTTHEENKG